MFRAAEDAIGAAPEIAILSLFGFVMYSNFKTGSTTTVGGVGPNPIISVQTSTPTANAASSILTAIQSAIPSGNASIINPLVSALGSLVTAAGSDLGVLQNDVQAAQGTLNNWNNVAKKDVESAISTLWGWVSGL